MRISAESIIAPAVIVTASSFSNGYEINIGTYGISAEHFLLCIYSCVILFRKHNTSGFEFGLVAICVMFNGILGALMGRQMDLHFISLILLCFMFPLFINFFNNGVNVKKTVMIAFALIVIQCIFFPNKSEDFQTWDYLVIEGFGKIQRLSIHGFVSNSLGLMLMPFSVYFLHLSVMSPNERLINTIFFLLSSVIILFTFSRAAVFLLIISFLLIVNIKIIIFSISLSLVFFFFGTQRLVNLIFLGYNREIDLGNNVRFRLWSDTFSSITDNDLFTFGIGLLNPPLDNTYLSFIIGAGLFGILSLMVFLFFLVRWLMRLKVNVPSGDFRTVTILIGILLISATTFDIFSQRKIIFGTALIIGALVNNARNIYFRG